MEKKKRFSFKIIKEQGKMFLLRFSKNCKEGSIKLHIILDDDKGQPHTHPWDFRSRIIFGGYQELSFDPAKPEFEGEWNKYGWLAVNEKKANISHLIQLRRFAGIKIPTITIGRYSEKKHLCSLCKDLGYCKQTGKPI